MSRQMKDALAAWACALMMLTAASAFASDAPRAARADPASDAPEHRTSTGAHTAPETYAEAISQWRSSDDVNRWIGARFQYDMSRALQLSETQRRNVRLPISEPAAFYASASGVCVDLARFAVETLRAIEPASAPRYLTIEFDPLVIAGNTMRRHWIVAFERGGEKYFFADSKRPGFVAGPYATTAAFIDDYSAYRGRRIVGFREVDTYGRQQRSMASRQTRDERN